jgi:hypothetical protein
MSILPSLIRTCGRVFIQIFVTPIPGDRALDLQPADECPIQWVPGGSSPGVKQPGPQAYHLPPTIAKVKKMWSYTSVGTFHMCHYQAMNTQFVSMETKQWEIVRTLNSKQ